MDNPEYFRVPSLDDLRISSPKPLSRSHSDERGRPPLPPPRTIPRTSVPELRGSRSSAGSERARTPRSARSDIANRVNKFEQIAKGDPPEPTASAQLWFYRDGLRSPTRSSPPSTTATTPPRLTSSASNLSSKSSSPGSTTSSVKSVIVSSSEISVPQAVKLVALSPKVPPKPLPPKPPIRTVSKRSSHSPDRKSPESPKPPIRTVSKQPSPESPKPPIRTVSKHLTPPPSPNRSPVPSGSPKLFHASERMVNVPASLILPSPVRPPRKGSPSLVIGRRTPPVPPPGANSPAMKQNGGPKVNGISLNTVEPEEKKAVVIAMHDSPSMEPTERIRLEEILDMCAEYERQIEDEQRAALRMRLDGNVSHGKPPVAEKPDRLTLSLTQNGESTTLPFKSNGVPQSPISPGGIQPNRIKTNGSLPREGVVSPTYHPAPFFAEADLNGILVDNKQENGPSPSATLSLPRHLLPSTSRSPYENVSSSNMSPGSPRTRIRTIARNPDTANGYVNVSVEDFQGGGEDMFATSKSKEELYLEAKEVLALVNSNSPSSTVPRKPPRSKHDRDPKSPIRDIGTTELPSREAPNRVLIGTTMLNGSRLGPKSPEIFKYANTQHNLEASLHKMETLRSERHAQVLIVSGLKRRLADLEEQEHDEISELELERSLLAGEFEAENENLKMVRAKLYHLRTTEERLSGIYDEWQRTACQKMEEAQRRIRAVEEELASLEGILSNFNGNDTDAETELLERVKRHHEVLEMERKAFEDMEFHQMEEEAHKQSEREELLKEIHDLELEIRRHEGQLSEIDAQQKQMLANVRRETEKLEEQRQAVIRDLEKEKNKLSFIERRLADLSKLGLVTSSPTSSLNRSALASRADPEDLDDTEGDEASFSDSEDTVQNSELEQSLTRLALLDRSQEEIDRISLVTSSAPLQQTSCASIADIERNRQLNLVKQGKSAIEEQKQRMAELKQRIKEEVQAQWQERKSREFNCNSLNSIGSEDSATGSTSDIQTESMSSDELGENKSTPSPDSAQLSRSSKIRSKGDASAMSTSDSRPLSEDSSFWDENESRQEVKRRQNRLQQQRPLTRYLPVRNENFDLRAHIETAGHQIELCSHIVLNSIACRGYLHKMGSKFRTWNKRWFVFDRNKRTLVYYSDKTETKAKGGIYFQAIEEVYVDHLNSVKSPNPKVTFCMKTCDRTYFLMAPTPECMRIWVDVIFTGAEGYQEFQQS